MCERDVEIAALVLGARDCRRGVRDRLLDSPVRTEARMARTLICILLFAARLSAQTTGEQKAADIARWIVAGAAIAVDASECAHAGTRCWVTLGIRQGVVQGASFGIAKAFPRLRPCSPSCGIDSPNNDIPSRHTAATAATFPPFNAYGSSRLVVAVSATTLVAALSMKATKHDLIGVATGAALGWATSHIR